MILADAAAEITQGSNSGLVIVAIITATASIFTTWLTVRQGRKLSETHKQVTVNHHSSAEPTVLDRIDDVRSAVLDIASEVNHLRTDFNGHITHSNEMDLRLIKMELAKETQHEIRLVTAENEVKNLTD